MDENKFNTNYNLGTVLNSTRGFNTAEELGKLHGLMEKGIITAEKFQIKKAKLL